MSEVTPFMVIRLLSGVPEHGVSPGAMAVVLEVHSEPYEAYEVEVTDDAGRTVFTGTVEAAQCVVVDELAAGGSGEVDGGDSTQCHGA